MRFGPFEIVRSLGAGGMAETSLAIRRGEGGFEQRVCLKRILPAYGKDKDFVRAFADEAKLAVRLEHPNICRLYDFGQIDGTYWMSLEICEGGDLRDVIRSLRDMKQPMPSDMVVLLALDLAHALQYAHALAVDGQRVELVHRDISPSNVLIDGHGHFKLADFGIARAKTNSHVTESGVVKGKAPYMSPDHVQGLRVDARDDLWSLGVMLYECLAGERPYAGATEMALMVRIMKGDRRLLNEAAPGLPEVLVRAVERLLAHDREQRTPTAAAFIEEIESLAPPPSARQRLSKLVVTARAEAAKHDTDGLASTDPALGRAPTAPTHPERPGEPAKTAPEVRSAKPTDPTNTRSRGSGERPSSDPPPLNGPATEPELTPPVLTGTPRAVEWIASPIARRGAALGGVVVVAGFVAVVGWLGFGETRAPTRATQSSAPADTRMVSPATAPPPVEHTLAAAVAVPVVVAPSSTEVDAALAAAAEVPEPSTAPASPPVLRADVSPVSPELATLDLTAVPWGTVYIDGRAVGDRHVVRRVRPGRHAIGAGADAPFDPQTVTLVAGQRLVLTLRAQP